MSLPDSRSSPRVLGGAEGGALLLVLSLYHPGTGTPPLTPTYTHAHACAHTHCTAPGKVSLKSSHCLAPSLRAHEGGVWGGEALVVWRHPSG